MKTEREKMARNKDITFDDAMRVVDELAREIKVSIDITLNMVTVV